jgi:hypothetical protein
MGLEPSCNVPWLHLTSDVECLTIKPFAAAHTGSPIGVGDDVALRGRGSWIYKRQT